MAPDPPVDPNTQPSLVNFTSYQLGYASGFTLGYHLVNRVPVPTPEAPGAPIESPLPEVPPQV